MHSYQIFTLSKIESIKKLNKLWTNDLAFIKDYLLIPVPKEKVSDYNNLTNNPDIKSVFHNLESRRPNTTANSENVYTNEDENVSEDERLIIRNENMSCVSDKCQNENASYTDFLNKFDSFLNASKVKLKDLETVNRYETAKRCRWSHLI